MASMEETQAAIREANAKAEREGRARSNVQQAGGQQAFGVATSEEQQRLQRDQAFAQQQARQAYGQQQDVYGQLQAQAAGTAGPSQAQLMLGQQGQQSIVDQQAMAAQGQGGSLAAQARQAQGIGAAGQMATAQSMAQLQQQEQMAAMQALQGQANTMGGQSQSGAQFAGSQLQGVNQFVQSQGQQQGQFDANMQFQQQQADQQRNMQMLEMGLGAAQGAAMMSDENVKDIEDGDASAEALAAIKEIQPIAYKYKDGVPGVEGRVLGFTTQQLERTPAGAATVFDTKHGKAVNLGKAVSLMGAGLSALAHEVEGMRRG